MNATSPTETRLTTRRVRDAVLWRSGSQFAGQLVAWASTFLVIRLLNPTDYGLFAMTQAVLVLLNLVNGYGIANALVRQAEVTERELRQALGLLLLLNGTLALLQFLTAPAIAAFYGQPQIIPVLRVQALLYFATPFCALPYAILSRRMDFRRQAQVRLFAAVCAAITALGCALAGWGIWTLVAAPMVLFYVEAIGLTTAARAWMLPLFQFRGARELLRYGGAMTMVQFFWFLQSQADIFMAGRLFSPHMLGIYTTALFLAQLLSNKFVPPLNDVAFAAYSRLHGEGRAIGPAFLTAIRLILMLAMPAYVGMAVTATPLVEVMLGTKWIETAGLVPILAVGMLLLTAQILFAPASNAIGRPGIAVRTAISGGVILPLAFLAGLQWGLTGLAWAWVGGMALLLLVTMLLSHRAIGITLSDIAGAVAPPLGCALGMLAGLLVLKPLFGTQSAWVQLTILVPAGMLLYALLLVLFARPALRHAVQLLRGKETLAD